MATSPGGGSYMIIQAMVLASELLVEPIVNDPVPRERTNGVPIAAEGPMLVRKIRLPGKAQGLETVAVPPVRVACPVRAEMVRLSYPPAWVTVGPIAR